MRFGKRRTRPVGVRRELGSFGDAESNLAPDESMVLYPERSQSSAETPVTGDPTQRLLTALGRFHRYVTKGEAGAPQQFWSDDCMNQLIAAVELSLSQDWPNIVEALTGTARILQSYENVNVAHMSIPFLNDSYEVLCLMVGDIIVNNQRSGVMDKWRERYEHAVAELTKAGYPLVQDDLSDDEPPGPEPERPRETPVLHVLERPAPPVEKPVAPAPEPRIAVKQEELLPLFDQGADETASAASEVFEESADAGVFEADFEFDSDTPLDEDAEPALALTEEAEEELIEDASATPELSVVEPEEAPEGARDPEVVTALDMLCDELSRLNTADNYVAVFGDVVERVAVLAGLASARGWTVPAELSRRMGAIVEEAARLVKPADDRLFDTAYAFCEAYMEASREPDGELARSWITESDSVLAALKMEREEMETPAAPDPVAAQDGSADSLLETARKAIGSGDMAFAKALALQAVAQLAKAETGKAETRVRDAEHRFQENAESIEHARAQVKKAEQDVLVAEGRVAEGGAELADARAHAAVVSDKVQGLEKRVAEIEEQIRALEAARRAETERVRETQAELERAREEERLAEQELEELQSAEGAMRAGLENARHHVKELQRHRLDLEEILSRARETLTHHRSSLLDIERTIDQVRPADSPAETDQEDMLF